MFMSLTFIVFAAPATGLFGAPVAAPKPGGLFGAPAPGELDFFLPPKFSSSLPLLT